MKEIKVIRKLNTADQHRLNSSLASYSASEPVLQEVSELKHQEGTLAPIAIQPRLFVSANTLKLVMGLIVRQRYRCKDCGKNLTDVTNTPLHRTHLKYLDHYLNSFISYRSNDATKLFILNSRHLC